MKPVYDALLGNIRESDLAIHGTPLNAVAASKVLTVGGIPSANDTVSIGGVVYKFVAVPAVANDVLVGASAEASIDNLVLAVTFGAGLGINYGVETVVNPVVTAVKASVATMTTTAKTKGTVGNDIVIAENGADLSWAGAAVKLSGGVDGTKAKQGQKMFDATYEYLAIADNHIDDANWVRFAVGVTF